MHTIKLTKQELDAVRFAVVRDLETVSENPGEFPGEAKVLTAALHKLKGDNDGNR